MNSFCGVCGNVESVSNRFKSCIKCGLCVHTTRCHLGTGKNNETIGWECAACFADADTELGKIILIL